MESRIELRRWSGMVSRGVNLLLTSAMALLILCATDAGRFAHARDINRTPSGVDQIEALLANQVDGELLLLFIGSGQTSDHDVPARVVGHLAESGIEARAGMVAGRLYWLHDHARWGLAAQAVTLIDWDAVIIQESPRAAFDGRGRHSTVVAVGQILAGSNAPIILVEPWVHGARHDFYRRSDTPTGASEAMEMVGTHIRDLAIQLGAVVAPVGSAFLAAEKPEGLYGHDRYPYHASPEGAALAARVIADAIMVALGRAR